jgi:uracil-DNA glycosylase
MAEQEMNRIEEEVSRYRKSGLRNMRNNPVVAEGSLDAKIMLIGGAPGFNEDMQGRPFVGMASALAGGRPREQFICIAERLKKILG